MNIFFVIDDEIITPMLNGSILPGITRDSVIQMAKHWGMSVSERKISIDEVMTAQGSGKLTEIFGSGTAAVVSPLENSSTATRSSPLVDGGRRTGGAATLRDSIQAIPVRYRGRYDGMDRTGLLNINDRNILI